MYRHMYIAYVYGISTTDNAPAVRGVLTSPALPWSPLFGEACGDGGLRGGSRISYFKPPGLHIASNVWETIVETIVETILGTKWKQ